MKRFQLLFLLLALPMALQAADLINTLVVQTKNGTQHRFVLISEKPQITFEGTNLVVTCTKAEASATFALADVARFVYEKEEATGINELTTPDAAVSFEGGMLVISQIKNGETVCVYSADGRLQQTLKAYRSGSFRLSLASLPSGVYLVKTGTLTYKIMKR